MASDSDNQRLILGRYRIEGLVGRGGASKVHRARDVHTGQDVAVKEIPLDAEMARRAGAEVRAACRLSHPGIVRLFDFGEDADSCYLVSELVEGATLADRTRDGWVEHHPAGAIAVMADVLDGLAHAHGRGVTHRDVKPANILVDRTGKGRLADFGIARIAGESGLTTIGGLVGTVSYMAPEQARGEPTGPAADVYSSCVVLYEVLSGHNPLVGDSPGETLRRAADGRVPPLAQVRPDLPHALCRAIDDGLNPDPDRRPTPGWLAQALRAQTRVVTGQRRALPAAFRRLPALASGLAAAVVTTVALHRLSDLDHGTVAACAAGAGLAFAAAPWPAALATWCVGVTALAMNAPGLAMILGALGLVSLATLRPRRRLAPLVGLAPIFATLGLTPAYALAAGLAPNWRSRMWVGVCGMTATLAWQVSAGADPAVDGGRVIGVWDRLDGTVSPLAAMNAVLDPIVSRPSIAVTAGLLAVSSLFAPVLLRLRRGGPRVAGVVVWIAVLVLAIRALDGSVETALGALLPGGILVAAWAAAPWRRLTRNADRQATVTLRSATVERLPAA